MSPLQKAEQRMENVRCDSDTIEQRLSRLEAATKRLKAATKRLEADTQAVKSESNQLGREQRRRARMMRWHNTVLHGDLAAPKLRALQDYAREQALAFVGISRSSTAPDGKRRGKCIIDMVKDWENTDQTVLTRQQKMSITRQFGHDFVSFLAIDSQNKDMWKANSRAHIIDLYSWEERSFLMEAVDSSRTAAVRDGGRAAYIALFRSSSWEDERRSVEDKLAS